MLAGRRGAGTGLNGQIGWVTLVMLVEEAYKRLVRGPWLGAM
jgi:hypothetical protein